MIEFFKKIYQDIIKEYKYRKRLKEKLKELKKKDPFIY